MDYISGRRTEVGFLLGVRQKRLWRLDAFRASVMKYGEVNRP
jgi:hypothetical protein